MRIIIEIKLSLFNAYNDNRSDCFNSIEYYIRARNVRNIYNGFILCVSAFYNSAESIMLGERV